VIAFISSNHFIVDFARSRRVYARLMPRAIGRFDQARILSSIAFQRFGYIEMLVKPGMVLISLT
jgi:hypothetical protein